MSDVGGENVESRPPEGFSQSSSGWSCDICAALVPPDRERAVTHREWHRGMGQEAVTDHTYGLGG
jgi:hypothetical protein